MIVADASFCERFMEGNAAWHRWEAANKNLTVDCSRRLQQTRLWSVGVRAALGCCLLFNGRSSVLDTGPEPLGSRGGADIYVCGIALGEIGFSR